MSVRRVMSNGIARALVALLSLGVFVVAAQPTATAQDEGPSDEAIAQARDAFREGNHDYVEGRATTSSMVGGWKFERQDLLQEERERLKDD